MELESIIQENTRYKWLQELCQQYLPQIVSLKHNSKDRKEAQIWSSWMFEQFRERGLEEPKQQKDRVNDIRNMIKAIEPNHIALESMGLSTAEYQAINNYYSEGLEARGRDAQLLENPSLVVAKATELLGSPDWVEIAAGLAVVTGRRSSEILLTAEFKPKSAYSVIYSGQLKRRGQLENLTFEIPTLAPAQQVIEAQQALREEIDSRQLSPKETIAKYGAAVIEAVDRHFAGLIPYRHEKGNLYTHIGRSVYGEIAVHYYCPMWVTPLVYKATIQGHYQLLEALAKGEQKFITSFASDRHYDDYEIGDGQGNVDGRKGIKLNQPEVVILETFQFIQQESQVWTSGKLAKSA